MGDDHQSKPRLLDVCTIEIPQPNETKGRASWIDRPSWHPHRRISSGFPFPLLAYNNEWGKFGHQSFSQVQYDKVRDDV